MELLENYSDVVQIQHRKLLLFDKCCLATKLYATWGQEGDNTIDNDTVTTGSAGRFRKYKTGEIKAFTCSRIISRGHIRSYGVQCRKGERERE